MSILSADGTADCQLRRTHKAQQRWPQQSAVNHEKQNRGRRLRHDSFAALPAALPTGPGTGRLSYQRPAFPDPFLVL